MKNILVTGGNGMLAEYFKQFTKHKNVLFPSKRELDITNKDQLREYFKKDIDIIVHLAAITDVDWCEQNHKEAKRVNVEGTRNLVRFCKRKNISLIFTSTSAVFPGNREKAYVEKDSPSPANYYAKTKLMSERIIQKELEKYTIIRLGWLIGKKKKFLSYILKQIEDKVDVIKAVSDIKGTITYAYDAVNFIDYVIETERKGIYHLASKNTCSRYDIAKKIVSLTGSKIPVIPVENKSFAKKFPAPRPENESIVTGRKIKGYHFPQKWQLTLKKIEKVEGLL